MKFDSDRAMAGIEAFAFPRGTGTEGELRAADLTAEGFAQAGWHVARSETRVGCRPCTVLMLVAVHVLVEGYLVWDALRLSVPGSSRPVRGLGFLLSLVVLAGVARLLVGGDALATARGRFAAWRDSAGPRRRVNVVASWPSHSEPASRVVIVTPLDIPQPLTSRADWLWLAVLFPLGVLARGGLVSPVWTAWIRVAAVLGVASFLVRYWLDLGRPVPGDNRTGLAILAELARVWPPKLHERVEVRLAAVGSNAMGQLGALTLSDEIRRHWPARPTLVINIVAAGVGPELVLAGGREALALARAAARDLWIPHRRTRWSELAREHWPYQRGGVEAVTLGGHRAGREVRPATLAATAQLASEIALRWCRRAGPAQPLSLARSSQKPG